MIVYSDKRDVEGKKGWQRKGGHDKVAENIGRVGFVIKP